MTEASAPNPANKPLAPERATMFQVLRAVSLGMLGVRSRTNYKEILAKMTIGQAFLGGIIGVIIFMTIVVILVTLAIKYLQ